MADKDTTRIVLILGAGVIGVAVLVEVMGRQTAASSSTTSTTASDATTVGDATDAVTTASATAADPSTAPADPSSVVVNVAAPAATTQQDQSPYGLTFPAFPGLGFGLFSPVASTSTSAASAPASAT